METIAAYSGGGLPAAIGIVRVSGPAALSVLEQIFAPKSGKKITDGNTGQLIYGKLLNQAGKAIDFCLAAYYRAPKSYTGEHLAEVFCHGGRGVVEECLRHIYALGARPAMAGEFTKRAFLNGKLDLIEAEAVADLIESKTGLAAQNAALTLEGALSHEVAAIRERLSALLSHFYAVCDYTDEDLGEFTLSDAQAVIQRAEDALQALLSGYERGSALNEGVPVAILGRPNAGKSTLFNALLGFGRAIVSEEPGTTRDTLDHMIRAGDAAIRLLDTAGIRAGEGQVECMGIERSLSAAKEAEGLILVFDGAQELNDEDRAIMALAEGKRACAVINKADLPLKLRAQDFPAFERVITLSARGGEGTEELALWLSTFSPSLGAGVITSARQAGLLRSALSDLGSAHKSLALGLTADAFLSDIERVIKRLGEMTGQESTFDIAGEIFSRFCVGK